MNVLKHISVENILPDKEYIVLEQEFERFSTSETIPQLSVKTKEEIMADLRDRFEDEDEDERLSWKDLCELSLEDPENMYLIYTGDEWHPGL